MYAIFNKDGDYLYTTDKEPVDSALKSKKLSDSFAIGTHRFVGDYDNGREVLTSGTITTNSQQKITIGLSTLKNLTTQQIEQEYNLYEQLNIISECLYEVCDKRSKKNPPINKFLKMHSYIKSIIEGYRKNKSIIEKSSNIKIVNDLNEDEAIAEINDEFLQFRDKVENY
jgi:hypothetical protein